MSEFTPILDLTQANVDQFMDLFFESTDIPTVRKQRPFDQSKENVLAWAKSRSFTKRELKELKRWLNRHEHDLWHVTMLWYMTILQQSSTIKAK